MERNIRPFAPGELTALARFAQGLNARRETGSSFCCSGAEAIRRDFADPQTLGFACWEADRPVGLLSCFPDREKGNADCSLLLERSGEVYSIIAAELLSAAREALGLDMACTFFFPKENGDCQAFLEHAGARRQENEYILRLRREDWHKPQGLTALRPAREQDRDAFTALHDTIFPGAYASGKDIWADPGRKVYVLPDGPDLAAYGVLRTGSPATAEMIGVREDRRGRGYGRSVLHRLAEEAFSCPDARELELVVDADNDTALHLYFGAGFRVRQENLCYILGEAK